MTDVNPPLDDVELTAAEGSRSTLDAGRCCLVITGPPGAGKSSVSRGVAARLGRASHLDGDVLNELIVSGRVWALGEPPDEAARQVRLCNKNLCSLAANFADAGFTPVIDWIVPDRHQLSFYVESLAPRQVLLVVLAPSAAACQQRNELRAPEDQFSFDDPDALLAGMRDGFGGVGWWLDTSTMSLDETVDRIVTEAHARARLVS
jgi:adenylylsulfate kinase-like enzyme